MALDRVAGIQNYTYGGGVDYTAMLYAANLIMGFREQAVVPGICDSDPQRMLIKGGNKVIYSTEPDIEVEEADQGQDWGEYAEPTSASVEFEIDKLIRWKFRVDDINQVQSRFILAAPMRNRAAYKQALKVDNMFFDGNRASGDASNMGITAGADSSYYDLGVTTDPVALTRENVMDLFADIASAADEAAIPDGLVHVALPPWVINQIRKSDMSDASWSGDGKTLFLKKNGYIGSLPLCGLALHKSMQLYHTTVGNNEEWTIPWQDKSSVAFATQINESKGPMEDIQYSGKFYRGQQLFGYKTIRATGVGQAIVTKG